MKIIRNKRDEMKVKVLKIFVAVLLVAGLLAGCSSGGADTGTAAANVNENEEERITIAASFYPIYIILMNITMDMPGIRVVDMTQPTTGCLHDYTVTPEDMKNLEDASALVINGADMESFMGKVLQQFPDLKIIDSSLNIPLISGEGEEGDNPHLWVSVSNAILQVKNIGAQLSDMFPNDAAKFASNTDAYVKKLEDLKDRMHSELDGLPNRNIITFHEAFPYFAQEFDLNIVGVIEREPGSEPSAKELADTIDIIKKLNVKALFAEPQYPASAAETISGETGSKLYTLDPAVTGPEDPDAYIDIMENNLNVLKEALK
jgi:zinc transport system substrate-binding protein